MGYWSDLSISMGEGPKFDDMETFVCASCVVDSVLADLVRSKAESLTCDYCQEITETPSAASFNVVMTRIYEAFSTKYADAQDINTPWADGDWITIEADPCDVVGCVDPGWDDAFLDDVIDALDPFVRWTEHSDGDWSSVDPYQALSYGWQAFKTQILEKTRYLFLSEPVDDVDAARPDHIPVCGMLEVLGNICREHNLVHKFGSEQTGFRVRAVDPDKICASLSDVGVPPMGLPSAGRMNPAGIPYFYIALDQDTAYHEVIAHNTSYFTTEFVNESELRLVDFVNLPSVPSIFEIDKNKERQNLLFLYDLLEDMIKPVSKDGREHVEYVPTQVISEYFRYRFKDTEGNPVDGFIYPSVKNTGGINIAVFDSDNERIGQRFRIVKTHGKKLEIPGVKGAGELVITNSEDQRFFAVKLNGLQVAIAKIAAERHKWVIADIEVQSFSNIPLTRKVSPGSLFRDYRGKGLGSWLINVVLDAARKEGVQTISGEIHGADPDRLRLWYKRLGFVVSHDDKLSMDLTSA